ncbi:hypothetical protein MBM_07328 [Drepanopeziza brunnea f. sp. 'multigermtubi' MB_m1]|uniref:Uncharacterized protein n=1 Tax=Marssonina brunnea f. sp. multigermtubi (strain MB_m1) TaxID=1072389 RepID=K1WQH3_MARBU|nr:uncharacterized protein MBM_07328 [Drepanopeziza brunnea f. sp. 'multigermtubi' MB_m1]EKD14607.1 hypothetical protein MBM_07328 [Drepanopeziza brunnea f. sp. 'multigermtubi' MB_m1]
MSSNARTSSQPHAYPSPPPPPPSRASRATCRGELPWREGEDLSCLASLTPGRLRCGKLDPPDSKTQTQTVPAPFSPASQSPRSTATFLTSTPLILRTYIYSSSGAWRASFHMIFPSQTSVARPEIFRSRLDGPQASKRASERASERAILMHVDPGSGQPAACACGLRFVRTWQASLGRLFGKKVDLGGDIRKLHCIPVRPDFNRSATLSALLDRYGTVDDQESRKAIWPDHLYRPTALGPVPEGAAQEKDKKILRIFLGGLLLLLLLWAAPDGTDSSVSVSLAGANSLKRGIREKAGETHEACGHRTGKTVHGILHSSPHPSHFLSASADVTVNGRNSPSLSGPEPTEKTVTRDHSKDGEPSNLSRTYATGSCSVPAELSWAGLRLGLPSCRRLSAAPFPSILGVSYAGSCSHAVASRARRRTQLSTQSQPNSSISSGRRRATQRPSAIGDFWKTVTATHVLFWEGHWSAPQAPKNWTGGALAPETYPSPLVRRARKRQRDAGSDILQSRILGASTRLGRMTPNWPVQTAGKPLSPGPGDSAIRRGGAAAAAAAAVCSYPAEDSHPSMRRTLASIRTSTHNKAGRPQNSINPESWFSCASQRQPAHAVPVPDGRESFPATRGRLHHSICPTKVSDRPPGAAALPATTHSLPRTENCMIVRKPFRLIPCMPKSPVAATPWRTPTLPSERANGKPLDTTTFRPPARAHKNTDGTLHTN